MTIPDLEKISAEVIVLAKKTGIFLLKEQKNLKSDGIEEKSAGNYVTYVDKEAERRLVGGLKNIFPSAGFIAEEGTAGMNGESYSWVIDPIDGTSNFIHGLNPYCISIALVKGHDILSGLIYEPALDECFYAWKGGKACLNGKEITVNRNVSFDRAMIAYDMPHHENRRSDFLMSVLDKLFERGSCRQLGSAAIAMAYVACGRLDGYFHCKLSPWDMAAGGLIIRQAGGVVSDFSGNPDFLFGNSVIAASPEVYESLKSIVDKYTAEFNV
ncbi:MAG: inositol monophosphatase [Candidatus Azobacteroides sp.]|nr:inositol monophosphatase [Candidatus Azobacteroides sp.]